VDSARWSRIQAAFHASVDLPIPQRHAFLMHSCDGDEELVTAVLRLIDEDARRTSLLDRDVSDVAGRVLAEPHPSPPVPSVGQYSLKSLIGEGGMGVVYLAEREDLGNQVAIKLLRDAWVSPARRERFASEQRTLAQLDHPSIARICDADTLSDGTPWFAMEYVDGLPLTEYCSRHALPTPERLRLFRDVCVAVQHAHRHLIIHRDLKPSNILVTRDGAVKLLDFGIAKRLESLEGTPPESRTLLRMMTPAYAAPEQIRGEPAGVQTDIYALGVILYELLTGRQPFEHDGRDPGAEMTVRQLSPERPSAVLGDGGSASAPRGSWADLDVLCLTAMHADPEHRYKTVEALVRDIDHYRRNEPLEARPPSASYRAGKFVRRNSRVLAASAVLLLLTASLATFYTVRLKSARNAAQAQAARTERIQRFMLNLFEGGEREAGPSTELRIVTLLDRGVREARALSDEPAVQAELFFTLGNIYQKLGSYEQADALLTSALDQRRSLADPVRSDVVENLVALGLLRVDQARLDEAERLVREGLDAGRKGLSSDHPALAKATAALGTVLRERGQYDEATRLLDEAVRLYTGAPGAVHDLAATVTALANTHFYAGRLDVSESLNRRVLEMDRQLYGEGHPNVAHDLINLGAIQTNRGYHGEAAGHYRQALDILDAWYGGNHPETASAMTILGQAHMYQGQYAEATGLLRSALAIQEAVYGAQHPRVAFVLNELGTVASRRKEFGDAEAAFSRALEIYRATYGKHSRVGVAMANLATVYFGQEQYDRAERLFEEALALYSEVLPAEHLNIGIARIKLGRVLLRQRRYREAEASLSSGYRIVGRQTDPTITWLRMAREDLAAVYDALEQPDLAKKFRAELAAAAAAHPP
jgi:serine/threonine-protein kinase